MCWKQNLGPLKENQVLLTTELSVQLLILHPLPLAPLLTADDHMPQASVLALSVIFSPIQSPAVSLICQVRSTATTTYRAVCGCPKTRVCVVVQGRLKTQGTQASLWHCPPWPQQPLYLPVLLRWNSLISLVSLLHCVSVSRVPLAPSLKPHTSSTICA